MCHLSNLIGETTCKLIKIKLEKYKLNSHKLSNKKTTPQIMLIKIPIIYKINKVLLGHLAIFL